MQHSDKDNTFFSSSHKSIKMTWLTWQSLFLIVQPKSNSILAAVEMTISHLLLVIYHRLELLPTRHTTKDGNEIHRDNFRNFDRPVQHDKIDFLTKIIRPNMKLAIGPLRNKNYWVKIIIKKYYKRDMKLTQNSKFLLFEFFFSF